MTNQLWLPATARRVLWVFVVCAISSTLGAMRGKAQGSCFLIPGVGNMVQCFVGPDCEGDGVCLYYECTGNKDCGIGANGGQTCQTFGISCNPVIGLCGSCV